MEREKVKEYIGKKVLIILNNRFKYTAKIPRFSGNSFTITDKFGDKITLTCEIIALISEGGAR